MNRNPMIPPNFVTLRQLKEKCEQEEKLKKEEEERLQKLKEEEEERLQKLKEEEDRLRKLEEEEVASKTLANHRRQVWRDGDPRRSTSLDAHLESNGRPDHEGSRGWRKEKASRRWRKEKGSSGWRREKVLTDMPLSREGFEKTEVIGSDSGAISDIEKRVLDNKMGGRNPHPNRRGRGRGSRNLGCGRGGDGVTESPLSVNGLGAPAAEKEEVRKVTAEIMEFESGPVVDIKKRVSDLKSDGWKPNRNRRGRGRDSRKLGRGDGGDRVTELPLSVNGFKAPATEKEEVTKVTAKVIGSESAPLADIKKRFSDLKLGGPDPNRSRRGRGRGAGNWGRGGGDGGGKVWVKKATRA